MVQAKCTMLYMYKNVKKCDDCFPSNNNTQIRRKRIIRLIYKINVPQDLGLKESDLLARTKDQEILSYKLCCE